MQFIQNLPPVLRQFIKFSIVGSSSFFLDAGIYSLLRFLGLFPELAKAISFVITATWSYTWNRRWTFRSTDARVGRQYPKFLLVSFIGLVINTGTLSILLRIVGLNEVLSFMGAAAVAMFWNFSANKLWTFR